MPEFVNPFVIKGCKRKLTNEELIRAIRMDLTAEHEAVHEYLSHAEACSNPIVKKVLISIANEEKVHAGEFERLLEILTGDEIKYMSKGAKEVNELMENKPHKSLPKKIPVTKKVVKKKRK
jgi:rubrerythrin